MNIHSNHTVWANCYGNKSSTICRKRNFILSFETLFHLSRRSLKVMAKNKVELSIQYIEGLIDSRQLIAGSRLPSVRRLATELGFSVSTVVESYARMVSKGLIEPRKGAGYYVSGYMPEVSFPVSSVQYQREIDPLWISRQSLEADRDALKPGCGWLPAHWMPDALIRKAMKQVAKAETSLLMDYAVPHGHTGLRQYIARKKAYIQQELSPAQILLTDSATQSIDLIFRLLLKPGDVILIDDPCYFNFHALVEAHHIQAIAVPFTTNGPDIEHFQQALQLKPKIYLTNSGIHNPTGAVLSLQTAYSIAKMVEKSDMLIIEDDIFADFEYLQAPRYAALTGLKQVIQVGSFSKTLSASVRCGYIISTEKRINELIDLRIATSFSSSFINADIIYHALMDSGYQRHTDWLKKQLMKAFQEQIQQLAQLEIHPWIIPKAGIFLWCRLPYGVLAADLSQYCLQHGVILAPGNSFSKSGNAGQFLRFNVAQSIDKKVFDVLADGLNDLKKNLLQ